jgi:hypothetical protein
VSRGGGGGGEYQRLGGMHIGARDIQRNGGGLEDDVHLASHRLPVPSEASSSMSEVRSVRSGLLGVQQIVRHTGAHRGELIA